MRILIVITLNAALNFSVPVQYLVQAYVAAQRHGVEYVDMVTLLITEHRGAYPTDSVSGRGASGLYQLAPMWVVWANEEHSTEWGDEDIFDPVINTELAAMVVRYSQERVRKKGCGEGEPANHWVAHWKCAKESRHAGGCAWPVKKFSRVRAQLQEPL